MRPWVDAVDIARAMVTLGFADQDAVGAAIAESNAARMARLEKAPMLAQLLHGWANGERARTSLSPPVGARWTRTASGGVPRRGRVAPS